MASPRIRVAGTAKNDSYRLYYPGGKSTGKSNFERLYYVGEYDGLDGIDTLTVDWNLNQSNGKGARIDLSRESQNEYTITLYTSLGDYTNFRIKNVEKVKFLDTTWTPPQREIRATEKTDVLTGTAYKDIFQFSAKPNYGQQSADRITNFSTAQGDVLRASRQAFGISPASSGLFRSVDNTSLLTQALAGSAQFVYDKSTGYLYNNQNGTAAGFGSGGIFCIFDNKPTLTQSSIQLA